MVLRFNESWRAFAKPVGNRRPDGLQNAPRSPSVRIGLSPRGPLRATKLLIGGSVRSYAPAGCTLDGIAAPPGNSSTVTTGRGVPEARRERSGRTVRRTLYRAGRERPVSGAAQAARLDTRTGCRHPKDAAIRTSLVREWMLAGPIPSVPSVPVGAGFLPLETEERMRRAVAAQERNEGRTNRNLSSETADDSYLLEIAIPNRADVLVAASMRDFVRGSNAE